MKLRIWRLERQKKCLVWQKKYLQAVLQNVENEGNGNEHCRQNRLLQIQRLNFMECFALDGRVKHKKLIFSNTCFLKTLFSCFMADKICSTRKSEKWCFDEGEHTQIGH